ncbi:MAG: GDYXXLXY domain-containing protein [Pseudomonadota bacterium]
MIGLAIRAVLIIALPVVGLAALWALSDTLSRQGTDWEVEIEGYDPRDLLRGHYVEFRYAWPIREDTVEDEESEDRVPRWQRAPQALCLIGEAPEIAEAIAYDNEFDPEFEACEHKLIAQAGSVYGSGSLARGRLYVSQDRALELQEALRNRDQRGIVTIRQREDGVLTPLDIRFRPLTAEELEARDREVAQRGEAIDQVVAVANGEEPEAKAPEEEGSEE